MTDQPPPYGAPPPPYAAPPSPYGTPPPPYGYGYGYGYPPVAPTPTGTDGFAIASFVFGLIGGIPLGIGFGIAALRRVGRSRQQGKGFAIAGIALAGAWLIVVALVVAVGVAQQPHRNSAGAVTKGGKVAPSQLREGDCVEVPTQVATVHSMSIRPCSALHNGQVFARLTTSDATFPGQSTLENEGLMRCRLGVPTVLGTTQTQLHIVTFVPTAASWALGDRGLTCLLVDRAKDFTGDVRYDNGTGA